LQREFVEARKTDPHTITNRLDALMGDFQRNLAGLSAMTLGPEAPVFGLLETNLFAAAPLVAACPAYLPEYVSGVNRLRAEVKNQSAAWDLGSAFTRARLYRLIHGTRLALEEVLLQGPTNTLVPAPCQDEPSATPAARVAGVMLHSGDILLSRGDAPTSSFIARGNDYPAGFSHAALLHVDGQTGTASFIESHIQCGVAVASLQQYLHDKKLRLMALRLRSDLPALKADPLLPHQAASASLAEARGPHIPYDFTLDYRDHRAQFCSEVVSAAYERTGIQLWMGMSYISWPTVTAWLGSLGARHFETQEPADLEYDPKLCVVAEWRDPVDLYEAHLTDAVTDAMLDQAPPGEPLPYQWWRLPLARLAKAYSVCLNLGGKVGPVPEGMTATAALRADLYRAEHAKLKAQLELLAADFRKREGYAPPYWELVREAKDLR
jgi:hypothetical protein